MAKVKEWKLIRSEKIVDDQWITLRADTCELPSGNTISPFYVLQYPTWLNIVALTKDQQVVLVKQYRHGIGRIVTELPSGGMEKTDKTAVDAARRELLEETGYGGGVFLETGTLSPNTANHTNRVHSFLATDVELLAKPAEDEFEQIETVLKPIEEVIEMLRANEFKQALHSAALFYALDRLGRLGFS